MNGNCERGWEIEPEHKVPSRDILSAYDTNKTILHHGLHVYVYTHL